ncbi:YtxH domain-containing protein [Gordonia aurantiaca]|uniref:YtxH domain-containing protein n=1 Tax=Gordonia sp. B21 TaxID=3151852 RepID=UPI003262FAE7
MSRTSRSPDAFTRVGAAGVVPAVAIGAHGEASGGLPGTGGVVLAAAIGIAAALLLDPPTRRRRLVPATASAIGVLTSAQVACHWALATDIAGATTHTAHGVSTVPMLVTHLVAIPLSAGLIVVGAHLLAVAGSVIASLTAPVAERAAGPLQVRRPQPVLASGPALGGAGVRGPPLGS